MDGKDCKRIVRQAWNTPSALPMHQWLVQRHTGLDKVRLVMLGNAVAPACLHVAIPIRAHAAASVLAILSLQVVPQCAEMALSLLAWA
jgi:hypothetical protein